MSVFENRQKHLVFRQDEAPEETVERCTLSLGQGQGTCLGSGHGGGIDGQIPYRVDRFRFRPACRQNGAKNENNNEYGNSPQRTRLNHYRTP